MHGSIIPHAAINGKILAHRLVGLPNGAQARCLRRHDVYADAVVHAEAFDALAHEFQHLVFRKAVFVHRAAQRDGNVVRTHAVTRGSLNMNEYDARRSDIIGAFKKLLYDLAAALAHAERAQRAVARVAVRAEDHFPAAGKHLAGVLMNYRLICRNEIAAVLHRRREPEGVIVGIYRAAHGAQTVVAVCEHIGHGKALKSARASRLNDADIGDVMGNEAVKFNMQKSVGTLGAVRSEYLRRHCLVPSALGADRVRYNLAAAPKRAAVVQLYHTCTSL